MQVQDIIEKAKTRVESLRKEAETRVEKVRGEAKSRFELVSGRAENAIKVSTETLKKAGDLVSTTAKTVAKTNQDAAEDLYGQAKTSVSKAREAGFKAVSEKPADFLPQGRTVVVKAFEESKESVLKTAEELQKLGKTGYEGVVGAVEGKKPAAKKAAPKRTTTRKTTARKTTTKAASTKSATAAS
jgi:hypothetical protein